MQNAAMVTGSPQEDNDVATLISLFAELCDQDATYNVAMSRAPLVAVPERLVTQGFHVGESTNPEFPIEIWLRDNVLMSGAMLIDEGEAETLASLIRLATDGFVEKGSIPLKWSGETVTIIPQHRGRVRIKLHSSGLSAQLKRSQVHNMVCELRSAA
ncbi:hypothetical protein [Rhodanobacter sp. C05]|uniref:hypothetical protein n=1 Tax=Rhodanobacter sp. C05 TaxID=1945855 RepID=UPI00117AFC38|nr:hypothetical protein [Rhodanobacter sp. C05]